MYSDLMGGKSCGFHNSVYLSERSSSDHNAALLHFLKENRAFDANVNIEEVFIADPFAMFKIIRKETILSLTMLEHE